MEKESRAQEINIDSVIENKAPKLYKKLPRFVLNWIKNIIHQDEINDIICRNSHLFGVDFAKALINNEFKVSIAIEGIENLPEENHLCTFASNHPLGGLDGVVLAAVLGDKYPNLKIVVNDLLMNLDNLNSIFVPINKLGSQAKGSVSAINETYASDAQIVVFPSGMVSRKQKGLVKDLAWKKNFILKTIQFKRDVVPIHFVAQNSNCFYRFSSCRSKLGLPNFDVVFLPKEMFKQRNRKFVVKIGKPITWQTFDKSATHSEWADYVKTAVYKL